MEWARQQDRTAAGQLCCPFRPVNAALGSILAAFFALGKGMDWQQRKGSRIDGGGQLCFYRPPLTANTAQGKGMDWRPVNPAAHCGRRPFFAQGKAKAARRPAAVNGQHCPGQRNRQRKGKEWNGQQD